MNLNLIELTLLLSKQKVISLGLFNDHKTKQSSKSLKLYYAIKDGVITNENEIKSYLELKSETTFKKFKSRYTEQLLQNILIAEKHSSITDDYYSLLVKLLRLFTTARIIHIRGQKKNSVELYKYIYKKAVEHGFLDLELLCIPYLVSHFAYIQVDQNKYKDLLLQKNKSLTRFYRYQKLQDIYDYVSHKNVVLGDLSQARFQEELITIIEKCKLLLDNEDSAFHKIMVNEIISYAYQSNNMYEEAVENSKIGITYLEEFKYEPKVKRLSIYKDLLRSFLKLKEYSNAEEYLEKILNLFTRKSHAYFRTKGIEYLLHTATKNYDKLFLMTKEVISSKELKTYKTYQEEWAIRKAFLNILVECDKISPDLLNNYKKFRLKKFVNDVEEFSRDKRGINIAIHIVVIVHHLIRKEYDEISARLDSLNQYTFRYIKKNENFRSNCFIKMLLKMPEAEYHPIRTKRYVERYWKKLQQKPYQISLREVAVEMIPYEDLWALIIAILNKNISNRKKT